MTNRVRIVGMPDTVVIIIHCWSVGSRKAGSSETGRGLRPCPHHTTLHYSTVRSVQVVAGTRDSATLRPALSLLTHHTKPYSTGPVPPTHARAHTPSLAQFFTTCHQIIFREFHSFFHEVVDYQRMPTTMIRSRLTECGAKHVPHDIRLFLRSCSCKCSK